MLIRTLKALVKNSIKKSLYGKRRKKKAINVLIAFFISIKVMLTFSLTEFLTSVLRTLISITHNIKRLSLIN